MRMDISNYSKAYDRANGTMERGKRNGRGRYWIRIKRNTDQREKYTRPQKVTVRDVAVTMAGSLEVSNTLTTWSRNPRRSPATEIHRVCAPRTSTSSTNLRTLRYLEPTRNSLYASIFLVRWRNFPFNRTENSRLQLETCCNEAIFMLINYYYLRRKCAWYEWGNIANYIK